MLKTRSIPLRSALGRLGGGATGPGPDAAKARPSTLSGAEHHGSGGQRLSNSIRHGPCPDERRERLARWHRYSPALTNLILPPTFTPMVGSQAKECNVSPPIST